MTISEDYRSALIDRHERSKWGVSGGYIAGDAVVKFLEDHPEIETILDYGCGEGTLKEFVESKGILKLWTLYDPGMEEFRSKPLGRFDLVITTDVLEHVEPHMVKSVLRELCDLTGKFLYNDIACFLTGRYFDSGPYIGQGLHINLLVPDEWAVKIADLGMKLLVSEASLQDGWKLRYLSIQEAQNESCSTCQRRDCTTIH